MQLPEPPPPPLAPLWDRVLRARALPPDLDVQLLYVAIRDRLTHPEWEVRLHALRVLADLLPLSGNALSFPFDQVVDNLGHNSPNVRKAALDALKVFCVHCEDTECAARAIIDKCSYHNIRPHSANINAKVNVVTGLLLSLPSMMTILKRRNPALNTFPIFQILGEKLFDPVHRDVALRSLIKFRKVCGHRDYMYSLSRLDRKVQDKFRFLCDTYDEDSLDVYYAPRKSYRDGNEQQLVSLSHVFNSPVQTPLRLSTDSSSEDPFDPAPTYKNNFTKVIIETEIKFDSDTAITMTVLEENDTESEKNTLSEEDYDSSDRNMLKFSDGESETDVVVKKVRFGGESVKIRTPDSDNLITSEEDNNHIKIVAQKPVAAYEYHVDKVPSPRTTPNKVKEIKDASVQKESKPRSVKKSGIPLPVINTKALKSVVNNDIVKYNKVKLKSKSLNELYDYFRHKNDVPESKTKHDTGFALTLSEAQSPEKVPSPVEPHREVEVLHNLQRSPTVSPRRRRTRLRFEHNGFTLNVLALAPADGSEMISPRPPTPLQAHYAWEEFNIVPRHVTDQLHNTLCWAMISKMYKIDEKEQRFTAWIDGSLRVKHFLLHQLIFLKENWIAAVKAADLLHSTLLEPDNVRKVEPAALSLVRHMWALSDAVSAARAPAEGAVCALLRSASNNCTRQLLPALVARMGREPIPTGLPHAMLQRLALHHLVDLIFDPAMIGVPGDKEHLENAQLRATLCLARAAGPAAVLSAVRRRLAGTARADAFCNKLRERLNRPVEHIRPSYMASMRKVMRTIQKSIPWLFHRRSSQLPVPVRRRARSTPPPAGPPPPRRLRPLPDSAPLPGVSYHGRFIMMKPLSPIPLSDRDSNAITGSEEREVEKEKSLEDEKKQSQENIVIKDITDVDIAADDADELPPAAPRSPSIRVENYSEKSNPSIYSGKSRDGSIRKSVSSKASSLEELRSQKSLRVEDLEPPLSGKSSPRRSPTPSRSRSTPVSAASSRYPSPERAGAGAGDPGPDHPAACERDVRTALAECTVPAKHDDWEVIVNGLAETERLAVDANARAPAACWRAAVRATAAHVRSLRSRVARTACCTLGALFAHRGRCLDPELEEATIALLERSADVNRFLRADAAAALVRVACGSSGARAAVALARRGATHRAGPVRAAAARALAELVLRNGAGRMLSMPPEPRTMMLRAAGDLLGDANAETRTHARQLCLALAEDARFPNLLKEAMPPSRYRAIEKYVDKLKCR